MARRNQESKTYFKILLDGIEIPGFIKVSGLSTRINIQEESVDTPSEIGKKPVYSSNGHVTLYKKRTRDQPFWNWLKEVELGKVEKKTISIELIYKNKSLRGWKLIDCIPFRWSVSDITDNVLETIEEIELAIGKVELL